MKQKLEEFNKAKEMYIEHNSYEIKDIIITKEETISIADDDHSNITYLLKIRKLPFEALDYFARIGDSEIMTIIATKYPLLDETYLYLASQSEDVKISLSSNKELPQDIVDILKNDQSEIVRKIINRRSPA